MTWDGGVGHGSSTAIIQQKGVVGYEGGMQQERAAKVKRRGNRREYRQEKDGVSREGVPAVTGDKGSLLTDPALTHHVDGSELAEFDKESDSESHTTVIIRSNAQTGLFTAHSPALIRNS